MEEGTGIAIVTEVTRRPVVEVDEGAEVGFFTVRAKMYEPEHEYSADLFFVKILEPPGMGSLQNEQGSLMRHGNSASRHCRRSRAAALAPLAGDDRNLNALLH